ncbi:MAG: nucleotide exchange factor GrpE [Clostridium sp.]|nr:nucleotide exchange factor GrpE [Clostridium sp.]MCM1444634.1 nucleotide exchange factor GrpE [Candidatus Amulumruptor caecigallinarius]
MEEIKDEKELKEEHCECDEKQEKCKKKKDKCLDKLKHDYNIMVNDFELAKTRISELEDSLLREKAESINFKKRKEEETSKMLKYANEDLVKEILPIVDNFERALRMDDDNLEDDVSKFLSGMKMIYSKLISTLEKYGVKAIDGNNKKFDPTYHQAVVTEKKDGVEPEMVLEVLQKGYLLIDKVIRPAMVKVSE